ncbi:MAG: hypothetical protein WCB31_00275 [Nitrososphaeraceae archaeon]
MIFEEEKPKTRKDKRREGEILNMPEEELLEYIEQCQKSVEGLEKQKKSFREVAKLSDEEREKIVHEYAMKNFPEVEEYQKWLKLRNEKLKGNKKKK